MFFKKNRGTHSVIHVCGNLKVKNVNHGGYCKHKGGVVCVTCDNNSKHNVRPRVGYDNVTTGKGGV